jgi:5-methylthioribose kinase
MGPLRLDERNLPAYLENLGLVPRASDVTVLPAGDGNINWVRRAVASGIGLSWVVKQARPTLEAFPQYSAPTARIGFEACYFERVSRFDDGRVCPRIEHFDAENSVLVFEDLSDYQRMDHLLGHGRDVSTAAASIAGFLGRVHDRTSDGDLAGSFQNDEMQRLHGDHIFLLPYRENDFPVSPAVAEIAAAIRNNTGMVSIIDAAYQRYLEPKGALIHADVQPTNILIGPSGSKLLDAEIAHIGDPAFDIGVLLAHLRLASVASEPGGAVSSVWDAYANEFAKTKPPLFRDVARYSGIEMLRRTLGAARAPGIERDEYATGVLALGTRLVESPPDLPF